MFLEELKSISIITRAYRTGRAKGRPEDGGLRGGQIEEMKI